MPVKDEKSVLTHSKAKKHDQKFCSPDFWHGGDWGDTNAVDSKNPRLLLIGDSICNGYQGTVRAKLGKVMNITFWATSKCVTDKDYFRELDLILSAYRYDIISFNNGLHSLTTSREEWKNAYRAAVDFIRKKCPDAKLFLTNNTPLKDPKKTAQAKELNSIIAETAKLKNLPVIDLFSLMDPLDRNKFWSDTYHFRKPAVELQAERIAQTVRSVPNAPEKHSCAPARASSSVLATITGVSNPSCFLM